MELSDNYTNNTSNNKMISNDAGLREHVTE